MPIKYLLPIFFISTANLAVSDPLSAIDWLSNSLEDTQTVSPDHPSEGISIEPIETSPLSGIQNDTVGLFPAQISGIPNTFWGNSSPEKLINLIRNAPSGQTPAITAFWRRIILAEITPPIGMTGENKLLLARVDNLLKFGDLDPAEALLDATDMNQPQLFRRWFDISLLTQRTEKACEIMMATPKFAPTLEARIFCLARTGDWNTAAVTLAAGEAIGAISADDALLIGMFLDPEAFGEETTLPLHKTLTPLIFIMQEALGFPRPTQSLPLAFLHSDLQNKVGWKQRLTSAERLTREQSLPSAALLDLYLEGSPPASGGIWNRVDRIQKLNIAFDTKDDELLSDALFQAYQALEKIGLAKALADWYAPALVDHNLTKEAQSVAFKLAVLHGDLEHLAKKNASTKQIDQFVISIFTGTFGTPAQGDLQTALYKALTGTSPKTTLHLMIDQGRTGEAVLSALTLLSDGASADVGDIETALSVLTYSGFKEEAKQIACELLLWDKPI